MSRKIGNNYSVWSFLWQTEETFNDLPWFSVCTSGRIASSTKTSTNLHCTVTPSTVHREFKHQISLNMFLGGESQYTKLTQTSWQPVITFLRSVFYLLSLHALHTVLTTQPDCSVGWDCCNTSDGASSRPPPPPSSPFVYRAIEPTNIHELCRARSAPIIIVI